MIPGVDISIIQGRVPWPAVRAAGIRFAMMRCTMGNDKPDGAYVVDVEGAAHEGIAVGAYHFAYPLPKLDPIVQARAAFVGACEIGTQPGDMPPALDLEWPPREKKGQPQGAEWRRWGCSASQIRDWTHRYLDAAERLWGVRPLVYSYPWFLECIEAAADLELARSGLWLASYTPAPPKDGDALPTHAPWVRPTMVQWDGDGGARLPNGVDADFNVFCGDEDAFAALLARP